MPRMPATLPMATRRRGPVSRFIVSTNGANVATVAVTLMAKISANRDKSPGRSVSVPAETPALAMTMSAPPSRAMKSKAAAASAAWSVTSTV